MPLRPEQLAEALQQPLAPAWLLAGSEPLRLEEARDQVLAAARDAGYAEREVVEVGTGFDWERLDASVGAPSLFASRRILDLRLPTGKPGREGAKALGDWAEQPPEDVLLLVSSGAWDGKISRAAWVKKFEQHGQVVGIWALRPEELPRWVADRMRGRGLEPDREAVRLMADRVEGNLLAAAQDIDQVALINGPGPLTADTVREAVTDSARFDAFRLLDAVYQGQPAISLRVAASLRAADTPLPPVLGAMQFSLSRVYGLRSGLDRGEPEGAIFKRLGIWPGQQAVFRAGASRLDSRRLEAALTALARADRQVKGRERGEPWQTIERMIAGLAVDRSAA